MKVNGFDNIGAVVSDCTYMKKRFELKERKNEIRKACNQIENRK